MRRLALVLGAALLLVCLSACLRTGETIDDEKVAEALRSSILGVPGVTGGALDVHHGDGLSGPFVVCNLTSTAATPEELAATLDGVLQTITSVTGGYSRGTVSCAIKGDGSTADLATLGLASPATFNELRVRYP